MHDFAEVFGTSIEGLAICLSVGMIFTPLVGFVLFLRYINRKEKATLAELNEK